MLEFRATNTQRQGGTLLESKRLADEISFSEEKMRKNALFDSPHLFYDAY